MTRIPITPRGFSLIEMTLVIVIMGVIVAIAAPRFADASTGRRLSGAQRVIEKDVEMVQLRARATGIPHVIAFYPDSELIVAFEGLDINRDAIVFSRDLSNEGLAVDLSRTNIGGDENIVVSQLGYLEKDFTVGILHGGIEKSIAFTGVGFTRPTVTTTDTVTDIQSKVATLVSELTKGLGI